MSSWKKYKLNELLESVSKTHSFNKSDLIFLNTSDVLNGQVLHNNYSSIVGLPGQAKKSIKQNDILFSEIRPANLRFAYIDFDAEDYVVSTKLMVLRQKNQIADWKFLYKWLTSFPILSELQGLAESRSGTFPQITFEILGNLEINLPPIYEQKAIAEILSSFDDKIEHNIQINKKLEEMANVIYKHWFVDFIPFKNGKFIESELGMIPAGWSAKPYYNIAKYINGTSIKQNQFSEINKGKPIVKIVELKQGINDQTKWSTHPFDEKYFFKASDLLFSWSGNPKTSIDIFIWDNIDAILNQHIFKVVPGLHLEKPFMYFSIKYYLDLFITLATNKQTTGLGHFTNEDLKTNYIVVPSAEDHKKYDMIANTHFEMLYNNQIENQTLKQTRDYLIPKLISGEIRVKETAKKLSQLL